MASAVLLPRVLLRPVVACYGASTASASARWHGKTSALLDRRFEHTYSRNTKSEGKSRLAPVVAVGFGAIAALHIRLRDSFADCAAAPKAVPAASSVHADIPDIAKPKKQPDASYLENLPAELTFGAFLGFSAGYFTIKVGRVLIFFCGGIFIFVQYLVHKGWVSINWGGVEKSWTQALDRDGDGKVTFRDFASFIGAWVKWLTFRIPSAATFSAGFYYALSNVK